jgi:hypothetical protein
MVRATKFVTVANVSVLQRSVVGDSVADDLVDRGAARLGKLVVVEWRRIAVSFHARLVHHPVHLVSRHSHCENFCRLV